MAYGRKRSTSSAKKGGKGSRGGWGASRTRSSTRRRTAGSNRGSRSGGNNITIRLIQQPASNLSPMTELLQAMGKVEAPAKKKAKF